MNFLNRKGKIGATEQGQAIVEYVLLLVLLGVAAILVLTSLGVSISSSLNRTTEKIQQISTD